MRRTVVHYEARHHFFAAFAAFALYGGAVYSDALLAARGETPAAFGRRCIPADCVAPPSHIPDMLGRRALSSGRLAALGATLDFHHGLLASVSLAQRQTA